MTEFIKTRYAKYILFGLIIGAAPLANDLGLLNSSSVTVLGTVMFYAIVGIGLNVLLGYSGLISLGTAGFMGMGAYLSAYLTQDMNLPFLLSVIISVGVPLLIGLIIGLISLRIEGYYLAIATLGVAETLRQVFVELDFITGGFSGKNVGYPKVLFGVVTFDRSYTYVFITVLLVLILILTDNFINSRTGRALLAMRGSEAAAQAMGINLLKYKLTAFGVATLYTALGGVLYAHFIRFVYPDSWRVTLSLQILAVIVIGGMRTVTGPIIGSIIVFGIPELVIKQMPVIGEIDGLPFIFTGVLIIVVIMFYPHGLVYIGSDIKEYLKKRRGKVDGEPVSEN